MKIIDIVTRDLKHLLAFIIQFYQNGALSSWAKRHRLSVVRISIKTAIIQEVYYVSPSS